MEYMISRDGANLGSFTEPALREALAEGRLRPDDWAWREGMADWQRVAGVLSLAVPPPLPPGGMAPPPGPAPRIEDNAGMRFLLPVGRSGWAIAAGYLGLFGFLVLPAPLAPLAGLLALRDIRRSRASGAPKYGMGRAIFGLVVGALGTAILLGVLVVSWLGSSR